MPSVLVVEDDQAIRAAVSAALAELGHAVRTASSGSEALQMTVEWRPDVVVLDLGLPDVDGGSVLRMLRGVTDVPVVVATARDDERSIVELLDAGADDYLVKPYSTAQLAARLRAVLRRTASQDEAATLKVGALEIRTSSREAFLAGRPLELTRLEFDLLAHLAQRAGEVVTRRDLLASVWRQPHGGADKTIDVHVSWLRRKLGETAAAPRYLHTVRGVGVKLVDPDT